MNESGLCLQGRKSRPQTQIAIMVDHSVAAVGAQGQSDQGAGSSGAYDVSRELLMDLRFKGGQIVPIAPKSPALECAVEMHSSEQEGSGHGACGVLQPGTSTSRERDKLCMGAEVEAQR